jgi:putative Holliday junction resolvase
LPALDEAPGTLLGVDFGDRKIGIARTDPTRTLASPIEVLPAKGWKTDVPAILARAARESAVGIVVGLPIREDGVETAQTEKTRRFIDRLRAAAKIPVFVHDERYTSWEAGQRRISRKAGKRSKLAEDAEAAAIILESFLATAPTDQPNGAT